MADKYSLQFQLGTTLDKKGLEELKKQLDQIGLKSVNIGTNFKKLSDTQLKAFKDTTKAFDKRNQTEEDNIKLTRKKNNQL
jgi:formiminotetrahydrofolate cyclodeaminase